MGRHGQIGRVGTGGSGAGVSTGSTIYQFNLGGSLNYRLK
jgi:hypothetical protein